MSATKKVTFKTSGGKNVEFNAKKAITKEKLDKIEQEATPMQVVLPVNTDPASGLQRDLETIPLRDPASTAEQFPADYSDHDPNDRLMMEKLALANAKGETPFGQLIATDREFDWLDRKREAEAYANFSLWFAESFDKMSPEQKAATKKLFPTFYAERLKQLKKNVKLTEKLAELKLFGPETAEDLKLLYAAEAGYIDTDPLENILHPERALAAVSKRQAQINFTRGLLNPNRVPRQDTILSRAKNSENWRGANMGQFNPRPLQAGTTDPTLPPFSSTGYDAATGLPNPANQAMPGFSDQMAFMRSFVN